MKGRFLMLLLVLSMVSTACGGADLTGDEAETQGAETSVNENGIDDNATATTAGAALGEPDAAQDLDDPQTTLTWATSTTVQKTTPTTSAPLPPPEGTVPPEVAESPRVAVAIADLVEMVGADRDAIRVAVVEEVTWPNGSIGCPQPGMSYTQALVSGSRIILVYENLAYHYHSGGSRDLFYCATPSDPVSSGT